MWFLYFGPSPYMWCMTKYLETKYNVYRKLAADVHRSAGKVHCRSLSIKAINQRLNKVQLFFFLVGAAIGKQPNMHLVYKYILYLTGTYIVYIKLAAVCFSVYRPTAASK